MRRKRRSHNGKGCKMETYRQKEVEKEVTWRRDGRKKGEGRGETGREEGREAWMGISVHGRANRNSQLRNSITRLCKFLDIQ